MSLRSTHIGYLVCALLGYSQKIMLYFFFLELFSLMKKKCATGHFLRNVVHVVNCLSNKQ